MPVHSYPRFRPLAVKSRVLGNERRLFSLDYLETHEACIADLALLLHVSEPTMSKHVQMMLKVGFLESERRAGSVYVTMNKDFRPAWQKLKRMFLSKEN